MRRMRKCKDKDSDRIAQLASYGLKRGRCFLWQPILYQQNHRGTGPAEAEQCQIGILDIALIGQLFIIDAGDFDVDVYTIKEGAADLFLIAGNGHGGTTTLFDGVTVEAAGAPVQVAVVVPSFISLLKARLLS